MSCHDIHALLHSLSSDHFLFLEETKLQFHKFISVTKVLLLFFNINYYKLLSIFFAFIYFCSYNLLLLPRCDSLIMYRDRLRRCDEMQRLRWYKWFEIIFCCHLQCRRLGEGTAALSTPSV